MQTTSNDTKDGDVAEDFATFVAEFAHGTVNQQLGQKLREVIAACRAHGGKGAVAIKLGVAVKGDMASVTFSVKTSKPEPEMPGSIYFTTEDGALATSDPRQLKLPARVIDAPANIRHINGDPK